MDSNYVPDLVVGEEVRMNEKRNGKWVYKKLVDCGQMPSVDIKLVAHGIADFDEIWVDSANSYGRQTIPSRNYDAVVTLPYSSPTPRLINNACVQLMDHRKNIYIETRDGAGYRDGMTAVICVSFTKKNDGVVMD